MFKASEDISRVSNDTSANQSLDLIRNGEQSDELDEVPKSV